MPGPLGYLDSQMIGNGGPYAGVRNYPYQKGSAIFAGTSHYPYQQLQYGNGFFDVLKAIFKILAPIGATAAGSFISNTAQKYKEGQDFGDAAKASLKDVGGDTAMAIGKKLMGKGRKRKRASKGKKAAVYKRGKISQYKHANF